MDALVAPRRVPQSIVIAPERERSGVVAEALLTLGAVVGVLVLLLTLAAVHFGVRPLVVRSGSMEPAIPTGSMVVVRQVDSGSVGVGDIVSVVRPDGRRVTHRVARVDAAGLVLKGDANDDPDPGVVAAPSVERVVFDGPGVGRATAWLATPAGMFVVGVVMTAACLGVLRRGTA